MALKSKKCGIGRSFFNPLPKKLFNLNLKKYRNGIKKQENIFSPIKKIKKRLSYDRKVMGSYFCFKIPGKPVAKKRPRFARRGKFVITYNPQQTEEGRFLFEIQKQWQRKPLNDPIKILMFFYMPIPKSTYSSKRKLMERGWIFHTKRPDLDNLIKFVKDCLNGVVYQDDSQVFSIQAEKRYSEDPKTEVFISWVEKLNDEPSGNGL